MKIQSIFFRVFVILLSLSFGFMSPAQAVPTTRAKTVKAAPYKSSYGAVKRSGDYIEFHIPRLGWANDKKITQALVRATTVSLHGMLNEIIDKHELVDVIMSPDHAQALIAYEEDLEKAVSLANEQIKKIQELKGGKEGAAALDYLPDAFGLFVGKKSLKNYGSFSIGFISMPTNVVRIRVDRIKQVDLVHLPTSQIIVDAKKSVTNTSERDASSDDSKTSGIEQYLGDRLTDQEVAEVYKVGTTIGLRVRPDDSAGDEVTGVSQLIEGEVVQVETDFLVSAIGWGNVDLIGGGKDKNGRRIGAIFIWDLHDNISHPDNFYGVGFGATYATPKLAPGLNTFIEKIGGLAGKVVSEGVQGKAGVVSNVFDDRSSTLVPDYAYFSVGMDLSFGANAKTFSTPRTPNTRAGLTTFFNYTVMASMGSALVRAFANEQYKALEEGLKEGFGNLADESPAEALTKKNDKNSDRRSVPQLPGISNEDR